jgi:hypothetical protein
MSLFANFNFRLKTFTLMRMHMLTLAFFSNLISIEPKSMWSKHVCTKGLYAWWHERSRKWERLYKLGIKILTCMSNKQSVWVFSKMSKLKEYLICESTKWVTFWILEHMNWGHKQVQWNILFVALGLDTNYFVHSFIIARGMEMWWCDGCGNYKVLTN